MSFILNCLSLLSNSSVNGRNDPEEKNPQPDHSLDLNFSKFRNIQISGFELDRDEINIHLIIITKANLRSVCANNNNPFTKVVQAAKFINCYIKNHVIVTFYDIASFIICKNPTGN